MTKLNFEQINDILHKVDNNFGSVKVSELIDLTKEVKPLIRQVESLKFEVKQLRKILESVITNEAKTKESPDVMYGNQSSPTELIESFSAGMMNHWIQVTGVSFNSQDDLYKISMSVLPKERTITTGGLKFDVCDELDIRSLNTSAGKIIFDVKEEEK